MNYSLALALREWNKPWNTPEELIRIQVERTAIQHYPRFLELEVVE